MLYRLIYSHNSIDRVIIIELTSSKSFTHYLKDKTTFDVFSKGPSSTHDFPAVS